MKHPRSFNLLQSAQRSTLGHHWLEYKKIWVPPIHARKLLQDSKENVMAEESQSIEGRFVDIEEVEVEKNLGEVIPDLVVSALGKFFFIEVAYTHFVDEAKRTKLEKLGVATLEIDLSGLAEVPSMRELAQLVVEEPSNRTWIFNPKEIKLAQRVESAVKGKLTKAIAIKKAEKERYQRWVEQYIKMSDEEKLAVHLKQMGVKRNQLPDFLGVFIKFGNSFSTAMLVWQTAIFANFVYPAKYEQIGVGMICNWCYSFFKIKRTSRNPEIHTEKIAIWHFLKHLEKLGFLEYLGSQEFRVVNYKLLIESPIQNWAQIPVHDSDGDLPF